MVDQSELECITTFKKPRINVKCYNLPEVKSFFNIFGNIEEENTKRVHETARITSNVLARFNIAHIEIKEDVIRIQTIKGDRMDIEFNEFGQSLAFEITPEKATKIGKDAFSIVIDSSEKVQ